MTELTNYKLKIAMGIVIAVLILAFLLAGWSVLGVGEDKLRFIPHIFRFG